MPARSRCLQTVHWRGIIPSLSGFRVRFTLPYNGRKYGCAQDVRKTSTKSAKLAEGLSDDGMAARILIRREFNPAIGPDPGTTAVAEFRRVYLWWDLGFGARTRAVDLYGIVPPRSHRASFSAYPFFVCC